MHQAVYQAFEDICSAREISGSVLEVGAVPRETSLLRMKSLTNAREKIGINLDGPYSYKDIEIVKGNANSMECFETNRFDVVLCNAMLEHDRYFWKTIEEIKRVAKSGGFVVIGVPGFTVFPGHVSYTDDAASIHIDNVPDATIAFEVHAAPGDYYRFSPQAFIDVFFEGMSDVKVQSLLLPPRIIGSGINC